MLHDLARSSSWNYVFSLSFPFLPSSLNNSREYITFKMALLETLKFALAWWPSWSERRPDTPELQV